MKKIGSLLFAGLLACGVSQSLASAATAVPMRVGPVQNYGALGTSSGKVISQKTQKEVMLRGVSLFWSDAFGVQYYNGEVVAWAAENLGVDVIRFAMGITSYKESTGSGDLIDERYSYKGSPDSYLATIDMMVEAAIKNDIYLIIDWHSHRAHQSDEKKLAIDFFTKIAKKYKDVPNVIFEIYNEPVTNDWSTIKSYANSVVPGIRESSKNLILVGTPFYSQLGSHGGVSGDNIAYVFHFYAATHSKGSFGSKITGSKGSGDAVFISEWGTTDASGDGTPNESATKEWFDFMETNRISNCNWSFRNFTSPIDNKSEQSAMFEGDKYLNTKEALSKATYTASGKLVRDYLVSHKGSWADSLVAGKNSGSCAFKSYKASEIDGSASGAFKSGCTYTSSNEKVVSNSGEIKGAGYVIMTGSDGSKSVITITEYPKQTFAGFADFICRLDGTCNGGKSLGDLSGSGKNEVNISTTGTTAEGATITLKSLNTSVVEVKKASCTTAKCYGAKGKTIYMLEFKELGEAKIVATAPAVSGFQAMNDTITVSYAKAIPKIHSSYKFKSMTVELGSTTENFFPDTTLKGGLKISYLFNDEESSPYVSKSGNNLVAGKKNAIVKITATTKETDFYEALNTSVTVIVGDESKAENQDEYKEVPILSQAIIPFRAEMQNSGLVLQLNNAGLVEWGVYTAAGKKMLGNVGNYSAGSHWISMENLPAGSYLMKVRQGTKTSSFRWNKQ